MGIINTKHLLIPIFLVPIGLAIVFLKNPLNHNQIETKENEKVDTLIKEVNSPTPITLIATGDIVIGRTVNYNTVKYKDPSWPFTDVKEILSSGDITLSNVEIPFVKDCPAVLEGMVFCSREENIKGLVDSGIDVVTLANNHISDYGISGIENTVRILEENNIDVTGLEDRLVYKKVSDTTFAFLAFNDIYGWINPIQSTDVEKMESLIKEADKNSDVVIVAMHWGAEYRSTPDTRQIELAHKVADMGADVIIGNHPHWIQTDEWYNDTYIKYAHGNFVFDQMWSEETKKGVIGKYIFLNKKLVNVEFIPIYIVDYGKPTLVDNTNP